MNEEVIKIQGEALPTHPSQGPKVINERASIRPDPEPDSDSDDSESSDEDEDDESSDDEMKVNFVDVDTKAYFQ